MKHFKGLIAAPFTPMRGNGDIAFDKIEQLARMYKKNKIIGAFICGSTGEGASLSFEEKRAVFREWGQVKESEFKIIAAIGGVCLKETQQLALYAKECGLTAVAVVAPNYFKPQSISKLVEYCRAAVEVAPDMPFYYYHIPLLTDVNFPASEFLKEAAEKIPNLAGIKYTYYDMVDHALCKNFADGKYDILWGIDEILFAGLTMNARAAIGSTYNYAAPLYNRLIDTFQRKDIKEAMMLQQKALAMVHLLGKYGGIGTGKAIMKLIGLDCGQFRLPVQNPTTEQLQLLKTDLERIGFFGFCSRLD